MEISNNLKKTIFYLFLSFLIVPIILLALDYFGLRDHIIFEFFIWVFTIVLLCIYAFPALFLFLQYKKADKERLKTLLIGSLTGAIAGLTILSVQSIYDNTPVPEGIIPLLITIGLCVVVFATGIMVLLIPVWLLLEYLEEE